MAALVIVLLGLLVIGSPFLVHQNYCSESDLHFAILISKLHFAILILPTLESDVHFAYLILYLVSVKVSQTRTKNFRSESVTPEAFDTHDENGFPALIRPPARAEIEGGLLGLGGVP